MSSRTDRDLLGDILEAIRRAEVYVAGQSYEEFLTDTKTQDAVIRTLEIVGEATKRLSPELRASRPEIPWELGWAPGLVYWPHMTVSTD